MSDLISRQAVIDRINKLIEVEKKQGTDDWGYGRERVNAYEAMLHFVESEYLYPSVEPEKCGDIGEISDGYHTFNQLYHQRAILFAAIVNQNKGISWKSYKHSDGKYCFDSDGEWFVVGIDTPKGSYTYHYSKEYWDYFECKELDCGKEWDGHTEDDVIRLLSLASVEPERKTGKWEYVQYDTNPNIGNWHCSNCRLIVNFGFEYTPYYHYCPGCGAKMEVYDGKEND